MKVLPSLLVVVVVVVLLVLLLFVLLLLSVFLCGVQRFWIGFRGGVGWDGV